MKYSTLFFDLDDTLYPSSSGLWSLIRERMSLYMQERMNLPASEIPTLREKYYRSYGTTLRGLQMHHDVDANDYLSYVHDLQLEQYLQPNPGLREILLSLPQKRWIFTNADSRHAGRVLKVLGLDDCFDGIIDIYALNFVCKPATSAYLKALKIAGDINSQQCVVLDDSPSNLKTAQELGFCTVLINSKDDHQSDYCLSSLNELPAVMPQLWEERT